MSHYKWDIVFPVTEAHNCIIFTLRSSYSKKCYKVKTSVLYITRKYFSTNKTFDETKSDKNCI